MFHNCVCISSSCIYVLLYELLSQQVFEWLKSVAQLPLPLFSFFFGLLIHFKEGNVQTTTNRSGLACGHTFTKETPIHMETAGLGSGHPLPPGGWTALKGGLLTC